MFVFTLLSIKRGCCWNIISYFPAVYLCPSSVANLYYFYRAVSPRDYFRIRLVTYLYNKTVIHSDKANSNSLSSLPHFHPEIMSPPHIPLIICNSIDKTPFVDPHRTERACEPVMCNGDVNRVSCRACSTAFVPSLRSLRLCGAPSL